MVIVTIQKDGIMTIPKIFGIRNTKVVIIPSNSFFIVIPLEKQDLIDKHLEKEK